MRTYGRPVDPITGQRGPWVEVTTDVNGYNDAVYLTTLIQVLKLNLGESPFYGNFGIPAESSVVSQVAPDYYVNYTQQQFARFFASLIVFKRNAFNSDGSYVPTYSVNVVTQLGSVISVQVPA